MKITILGTRGYIEPSAPYHARHSGVLIDDYLLFDCGQSEFLNYKPQAVFITHLHPDHAYFVQSGYFPQTDVPFYAPEKYTGTSVKVLSKKIAIGNYTITPVPTEHSLKVKSQAYLIEKNNERILYTGDMFWIKKKYHSLLNNLTLVITEASYLREGGLIRRDIKSGMPYGHAGVPNLIRLFKPFTHTILFTHFGSWFYKLGARNARKKILQLGKEYGINAHVGYDGMSLNTKVLK